MLQGSQAIEAVYLRTTISLQAHPWSYGSYGRPKVTRASALSPFYHLDNAVDSLLDRVSPPPEQSLDFCFCPSLESFLSRLTCDSYVSFCSYGSEFAFCLRYVGVCLPKPTDGSSCNPNLFIVLMDFILDIIGKYAKNVRLREDI